MIRVGQGYDLHRVASGRALMLGGVRIPCDRGLLGHSDADVLLHSITDAYLGALALGDIGQWFPDNDERYRGVASATLLQTVLNAPEAQGWQLINLDCTIIAETPKLAPHMSAIRASLASLFRVSITQVSVKAKTQEGMGEIGSGKALAAQAVLLLEQNA